MTQPHQTWCVAIFLAIALLRPGDDSFCQQHIFDMLNDCPHAPPVWYAGLGQLTPAAEESSPSVSDVVQGLLSSPVTTTSGAPVAPVNGSSPESVAPAPAVVVVRFSTNSIYPLLLWCCCARIATVS